MFRRFKGEIVSANYEYAELGSKFYALFTENRMVLAFEKFRKDRIIGRNGIVFEKELEILKLHALIEEL